MMNIISLGAGVQSSTMALMAARGEIGPMPDCAIFADTQAEPASVYAWLDWLEKQLPYPVHRVSRGSLENEAVRVRTSKTSGRNYQKHAVPAFTSEAGKSSGILMRQCTGDFKIDPILRKLRELGGKASGVRQWIGISTDEAQRMKPVRAEHSKWLTNVWPLIDAGMSRADCLKWFAEGGYPTPPRSSCVFCPYHSNAEWRRLRDDEPMEFQRAVDWEKKFQATFADVPSFRGQVFLHRDLKPLSEVDLDTAPAVDPQMDMFGDECEGMCGV